MKKKLTYILIGALLPLALTAQNNLSYDPSKNLEAYVGTWEYRSGAELFQVTFVMGTRYGVSFYSKCVIGGYLYTKNGQTIADYLSPISTVWNLKTQAEGYVKIMGTNALMQMYEADITPNEIRIYFYDDVYKKYTFRGSFTLMGVNAARWVLKNDEGEYEASEAPSSAFSVPTNVVMKKIESEAMPTE